MIDRYKALVPAPRRADRAPGFFEFDGDTALSAGPAGDIVRRLLAPMRLPLYPESHTAVPVSTVETVVDDSIREPEGYRLTVEPGRIRLAGADLAGVRHAVQTLKQLLPDDVWRAAARPGVRWMVPAGEVVDHPTLGWRGGMLDVARHFMPKHAVLRYVDLFAAHRLNRLHLHLTDDQGWRIESRRHPAINDVATHRTHTTLGPVDFPVGIDDSPHGGYYSLADLAEIAQYGAEHGVTVVPEIDLPGHCSALIAAYPDLGSSPHSVATRWGVLGGTLRPVPATIAFVCDLLDELMSVVPGPYLHVGGDECVVSEWPDDPVVRDHMRAIGVADPVALHGRFLRELADHVASRGRRTIMWDEAFLTGGLREDSIMHNWRGNGVARRAAAAGYEVLRAPVMPTYLNYYQEMDVREPVAIGGPIRLSDVAAFDPVPADWDTAEADKVVGIQFQAWAEYLPDVRTLDYQVFPRACALAEVAWTGHRSGLAVDRDRLTAHLARLAATGVEYRPLDGPRPWQEGGLGPRQFRAGQRRDGPGGWLAELETLAESGTVTC